MVYAAGRLLDDRANGGLLLADAVDLSQHQADRPAVRSRRRVARSVQPDEIPSATELGLIKAQLVAGALGSGRRTICAEPKIGGSASSWSWERCWA